MADRIDIGVGPRIAYDEPTSTSGFSYTGQETLSRENYGSQFVDFYSQSLDIPSLSEQTGIDPNAPGVGEDIQLKGMAQDNSDGREDSEAGVIADLERALTFDQTDAPPGEQSSFGSIKFSDGSVGNTKYKSYADVLKAEGQLDRVAFSEDILAPVFSGNYDKIDLSSIGTRAADRATGLPGEAAKQVEETAGIFTGGYGEFKKRASKKAPKAFTGIASAVGGVYGSAIMGALTGKSTQNYLGNMTNDGAGFFSAISNMNKTAQFEAYNANRAISAANQALQNQYPGVDFTDPAMQAIYGRMSPTGFSMEFAGGMGIIRQAGKSNYIGNLQDIPIETLKAFDALHHGFVPSGFNAANMTGKTLADEGYNSGKLGTGGYYRDNGSYMSPTGQTAAMGYKADATALGENYGFTGAAATKVATQAIQDARNGKGTVSSLMKKAQADAAKQVADEQRPDEEAAAQATLAAQTQQTMRDAYNRSTGGGSSDENPGGSLGFGAGDRDTGSYDEAGMAGMFASGGRIGMAAGGPMAAGMEPSGFIGAPPSQVPEGQTVADNVKTQEQEGTFIINAAAVEFAGESDIITMLNDAQKEAVRRGIVLDNRESNRKLIDVAVSRGEVKVAPHLVKIIGEDRLTKINNRGKPETQERIQENGQQMAAQGGFIGLANGGTANSSENYEDKIIVDEVRRKMEAIFKVAEDRGLDVTSEYPGPEEQKYFEDIARLNPGTQPITGKWSAGPGEMNVPNTKTPTLFNLFALAEEMAHTEYFDSEGPSFMDELKKYSPIYRYNQSKRSPQEKDFERTFNRNEEAYAEEMRAKSIAYEVVGGLLPKAKATAEMTKDYYANHFYDYLRNNAEKPIIEAMLKKYPDMAGRKRVVFPEYENEYPDIESVQAKAEGGFLGFLDSINPFSSSEQEAPQQGFATVPVTPTGPQPVQAGTEYAGDEGDDIPETALQAPPAFVAQLEQHYKKPVTRTQNKKLYDKMSNEQLLAHMLMAETKSSTDPEEAMYAVGQTAIHRRNSNEPEFRKQKSLRDVLLKRLSKGAFEYAGMDVKRNKGLKENFTTNRANYERGLARATAIAQDLLGGEMESDPAVSPDVMWYTRQDAPNQWMRNNLTLVEIIGEHEFYKAPD